MTRRRDDSGGELDVRRPADPVLEGVTMWFEGLAFGDFPLRVSPPVGGVTIN